MNLFRSRHGIGPIGRGATSLLIALGLLAGAESNAQLTATGPEPPAAGAEAAVPAGAEAGAASGADTPSGASGSPQYGQSAPREAPEPGRSKRAVRMQKPAVGGLSIPATARPEKAAKSKRVSPYRAMEQTNKSREFYSAAWGVDRLRASSTSSGNLIRFTFRVVQPKLAKPLGDHEANPYMFAPQAHAVLQVPTMEKIGQLRQLGTLEPDKEYWMVFSNKGNLVHPGDRVDVIIGKFHADGLLVE